VIPAIKAERPPNFDQIVEAFPDAVNPGVIFAYGDTIYNPSGGDLPAPIIAHEAVHCYRQGEMGYVPGRMNTAIWWNKYIADPTFRYEEELAAHVAEYVEQVASCLADRNQQAVLLMRTARRLIAPLYKYGDTFTLQRAMRDITRVYHGAEI
jgi:hypothetical protein